MPPSVKARHWAGGLQPPCGLMGLICSDSVGHAACPHVVEKCPTPVLSYISAGDLGELSSSGPR